MSEEFVFVGVETAASSVNRHFARWTGILGVDWTLRHYDVPLNARSAAYEECVTEFRAPDVVGGLVTTHKAALYRHAGKLFDSREPLADRLAEVGVIYKDRGLLVGGVSDVVAGGGTLLEILEASPGRHGPHAVILGAGGAGVALAWNLAVEGVGSFRRVTLLERDTTRAEQVRDLIGLWGVATPLDVLSFDQEFCDELLRTLPDVGLLVNATGMGKDRPGSPIQDAQSFPDDAIVWEFNYRGPLGFLAQAREAAPRKHLVAFDGTSYFYGGWSSVMARVAGVQWTSTLRQEFEKAAQAG